MTTSSVSVSLRNLIDSARRLDELDAARVIASVAEVVHKQQKGGQPLHTLTPDGITISPEGEPTLAASAAALPAYTAPERLRGEPGDRRSDVFSLGAILWEALAHQPHFEGEIDGEIKAAVLEGEYRSVSELNANVPAELDAICKKALARAPADRYPSAKVMAAELATVLDDAGYPDDNSLVAAHVQTKYVAPAPKPAKVPSSRDTPMPGTPIIATPPPAAVDLHKSNPTQTLQGVAPRKELDAALAKAEQANGAPASNAGTPSDPAPAAQPLSPTGPAILNTPPPATASSTENAASTAAPKSFSKTAVLGSLSSADLGLPPVEAASPAAATAATADAVPVGRKTELHGSVGGPSTTGSAIADKLAAINQGTESAQPGGVLMLGLPAVPPGADPSSFKTPLPGTLPPVATLAAAVATPAPANITTAETVATPALPSPPPQLAAAATGVAVAPDESEPAGGAQDAAADVHPASVVALPRAGTHGEKRDPVAGWGWGTGQHERIDADDDEYYEPQTSSKKRLVYAIGGAAVAVLLIVVAAFAFGGGKKDEKKPDVAAKQAEPAVDWSQPTDSPSTAQPDPNTAAVDPSGPREGSNGGSNDGAHDGANHGSNAGSTADSMAASTASTGGSNDGSNGGSNGVVNAGSNGGANVGSTTADAVGPNVTANTGAVAGVGANSATAATEANTRANLAGSNAATAAATPTAQPAKVASVPPTPVPPTTKAAKVVPVPPTPVPPKPEPKVAAKPEPKVVAKTEPKKATTKKLPPPQPVAKTRTGSWDPLAPSVKPADGKKLPGPGPVDPYASDAPAKNVDPNVAYKTGIQQFARGDSNGALTTFKASLASHPNFPSTWRGIGMVYEKLGKRALAKNAFKRYLQLSPSAGDAASIRDRMERL